MSRAVWGRTPKTPGGSRSTCMCLRLLWVLGCDLLSSDFNVASRTLNLSWSFGCGICVVFFPLNGEEPAIVDLKLEVRAWTSDPDYGFESYLFHLLAV